MQRAAPEARQGETAMTTEKIIIPHKAVKLRKKKPPPAAAHRDRRVYTRKAKHKKKALEQSGAFSVAADLKSWPEMRCAAFGGVGHGAPAGTCRMRTEGFSLCEGARGDRHHHVSRKYDGVFGGDRLFGI
jgi:hypothetical protein